MACCDGGPRIDAIGIQSHLSTAIAHKLDQNSLASFLREISDRSLKIMVTEMDAIDVGSPSDIATRDTQVASLFKRYLDVIMDDSGYNRRRYLGPERQGKLDYPRRSEGLPPFRRIAASAAAI